MNDIEAKAKAGMESFITTVKRLAPHLQRIVEVTTEPDEDIISFKLGGYSFSIYWESMTGMPAHERAIQYILCIWTQTHGSRYNPPEDIDTTLIKSQSIIECVRVLFETAAKMDIQCVMQNDSVDICAEGSDPDKDPSQKPACGNEDMDQKVNEDVGDE